MHSFELFVKSLQSAIVNSTESINSRNKKVLDDYFERDVSEIILENKTYNKDLFSILQPIKNSEIFSDFSKKDLLDNSIKTQNEENTTINEDEILANFLLYSYNNSVEYVKTLSSKTINKSHFLYKLTTTSSIDEKLHKELENLYFYNPYYYNSLIDEEIVFSSINSELKEKRENILILQDQINSKQSILDKSILQKEEVYLKLTSINEEEFPIEKNNLDNILNNLLSKINQETLELDELNLNINQLKKEIELYIVKQSAISDSFENKKKDYFDYLNILYQTLISSTNFIALSKSFKNFNLPKDLNKNIIIYIDEIILLIKGSKRYIKKTIESLIPKTVRVNYPATFDYATPDNDREFKTITTPVEVPLITLVPISNYNIEKATFTANFKFDVVKDKVMVDFSKDSNIDTEQNTNFGKLEITLSPQQTPEGLKSLIESYENFLKRQIV